MIGNKVFKIIVPSLFPLQGENGTEQKIADLLKCLQETEECINSLSQESEMLEALIIRKGRKQQEENGRTEEKSIKGQGKEKQ